MISRQRRSPVPNRMIYIIDQEVNVDISLKLRRYYLPMLFNASVFQSIDGTDREIIYFLIEKA